MSDVKAVLFDLDDTLFDHAHCARTALGTIRASHASLAAIDPLQLEHTHSHILEDLHGDVAVGRLSLDVARMERFRRLFRFAGFEPDDALSSSTAAAYRQAYIDSRRAVEGAAALLEAVRIQARVGIVTNNLVAEQREKLRDCGLDRHIDVLMASEEAGVSKPNPAIFALALERLGCLADEAVMVGDSWENDIVGAQSAGIRAVWFNPRGEEPPTPGVPVLRALAPVEAALAMILADRRA